MADTDMKPADGAGSGASDPVGTRLRKAREAAGLTLAQLSDTTKIPARMLLLIEEGDFAALPARTYATGFTRSYARALGLDERECVNAVRGEIGLNVAVEHQLAPAFEPGDPARVPSAQLAWLATLAALAVLLAGLFLWRTYYAPAVSLPSLLPEAAATATVDAGAEFAPAAVPDTLAASDAALPSDAATGDAVTAAPVAYRAAPAARQNLRSRGNAYPRRRAATPPPGEGDDITVSTGAI